MRPLSHFSKIQIAGEWCQFLYATVLLLLLMASISAPNAIAVTADPDPLRFQKEIRRFSWQDAKNSYPEQAILFIGSSSVYAWKTAQAFPRLPVINRGFGGSQISDLNYYFEVVVSRYHPAKIVCYCGENDIAENKEKGQILTDFKDFSSRIRKVLPETELIFLAIKPNPLRWNMWQKMAEMNRVIKDYCEGSDLCIFLDTATPLLNTGGQPDKRLFAGDGLHLNEAGYAIWNQILTPYLAIDSKEQL
jgi:lysophospholipase L1-like esterase